MVVYAEFLFLENFITGLVLLYFTARLTALPGEAVGRRRRFGKLVAGGVLCGCSGFFLFVPAGPAAAVGLRFAAAMLICLTTFGRQNLLKQTVIFILLSFLSGGAAMAFFLWQQIPALSGNGVLYLEAMTYVGLAGCGLPAMAATLWFIRLIKKQREADFNLGEVELRLEGRVCCLMACVDSGNSLRDPVSGQPVILVDQKGSLKLPFRREDYPQRFAAVPYEAVGVEKGILTGIRLDAIQYGHRVRENVILVWYEGRFEGFDVLLNREILEGGLLDHDKSKRQRGHERTGQEILPDAAADADGDAEKAEDRETLLYRGQ